MTATARRDELWARIVAPEPDRPPAHQQDVQDLISALAMTREKHAYLAAALEHPGDTVPASRSDTRERAGLANTKIIHAVGVVAAARWTVAPGSPWTGLLGSGPPVPAVVRASISSTFNRHLPEERPFAPSVAVKLFVDDPAVPTENLVALHRLEGLPPGVTDFFAEPLTTTIPSPLTGTFDAAGKARWHALLGVFQGATAWWKQAGGEPKPPDVLTLDLGPLCAVDRAGNAVPQPRAPTSLAFRATAEARAADPDLPFRERLMTLPAGTRLYTVNDEDGRHVASVDLETPLQLSGFADHQLFFRHAIRT